MAKCPSLVAPQVTAPKNPATFPRKPHLLALSVVRRLQREAVTLRKRADNIDRFLTTLDKRAMQIIGRMFA